MPDVVELARHHKDAVFILFSLSGIFLALAFMGLVYRGSTVRFPGPVKIGSEPTTDPLLVVSPRHLDRTHHGKGPYVEFRSMERGKPLLRRHAMEVQVQHKDSDYIKAPDANNAGAEGGKVCIDLKTLALLRTTLKPEHPDLLDHPLYIRIKYPLFGNALYLFKDHPDLAVRASAWVFLLTSIFAVFQTILLHALNY
jgi:hypothetical protein